MTLKTASLLLGPAEINTSYARGAKISARLRKTAAGRKIKWINPIQKHAPSGCGQQSGWLWPSARGSRPQRPRAQGPDPRRPRAGARGDRPPSAPRAPSEPARPSRRAGGRAGPVAHGPAPPERGAEKGAVRSEGDARLPARACACAAGAAALRAPSAPSPPAPVRAFPACPARSRRWRHRSPAPAAIGVLGSGSVPRCGPTAAGRPGRRGPGACEETGPAGWGEARRGTGAGLPSPGHPEETPNGGARAKRPLSLPLPLGPGPFPSPAAAWGERRRRPSARPRSSTPRRAALPSLPALSAEPRRPCTWIMSATSVDPQVSGEAKRGACLLPTRRRGVSLAGRCLRPAREEAFPLPPGFFGAWSFSLTSPVGTARSRCLSRAVAISKEGRCWMIRETYSSTPV